MDTNAIVGLRFLSQCRAALVCLYSFLEILLSLDFQAYCFLVEHIAGF